MTHFFGVRDPGRAGGSWLMQCFNRHPAGISVLGEAHLKPQLNFPYPDPDGSAGYDQKIIAFLKSQVKQGKVAVGMVKCFHARAEKYMRTNGGRFATLLRNPMELVGCWKGRRGWGQNEHRKQIAVRAVGHFPPQGEEEEWKCLLSEVKEKYIPIIDRAKQEPLIRIEDMNRSLGGDGRLFQAVCEWITQVPFPTYYIDFIREHFLPGYRYPIFCLKDDRGIVVSLYCIIGNRIDPKRMTWADDKNPSRWFHEWASWERSLFMSSLQETCEQLGYNCTINPGYADVEWAMKGKFPWAGVEDGLELIP